MKLFDWAFFRLRSMLAFTCGYVREERRRTTAATVEERQKKHFAKEKYVE